MTLLRRYKKISREGCLFMYNCICVHESTCDRLALLWSFVVGIYELYLRVQFFSEASADKVEISRIEEARETGGK